MTGTFWQYNVAAPGLVKALGLEFESYSSRMWVFSKAVEMSFPWVVMLAFVA